jgi:hypothetical protein
VSDRYNRDGTVVILLRADGHPHPDNPLHAHRQVPLAPPRTSSPSQIHFIHETGIGILIGLIFGFIIYWAQDISDIKFD